MFSGISRWFGGVWSDARAKIDIEGGHGEGNSTGELVRHLGLVSVIFFTVTQAVGAGILTTPGVISAKYAGSWGFMSYVWAGLIVFCPALCIAYNAARSSKAGSTGSYASKHFGQLVGLLLFVDVMLECIGGTAAVAVSQGEHIKLVVNILGQDKGAIVPLSWFEWFLLPALLMVLGFAGAKLATWGLGFWGKIKELRAAKQGLLKQLGHFALRVGGMALSGLLLYFASGIGADFLRRVPEFLTTTPKDADWTLLGYTVGGAIAGTWLLVVGWKVFSGVDTRSSLPLHLRIMRVSLRTFALLAGAGLAVFGVASGLEFVSHLSSVNLLSVVVVLLIIMVLLRGIKETAWLTNVFTALKLLVLAYIIYRLGWHFDWANINRPIPEDLPGTFAGASTAFFAYVGLDMATTAAGETKNPQRNVPLGMLVGAVIVMLLYVAAAMALNGAVPYEKLEGSSAPFSKALVVLGYTQAATYVAIASTLAMVSVVLASAYSTTRLLYNVSEHDMLPWFNQVTKEKTFFGLIGEGVPVVATLTVGALLSMLTGLLDVDELMHLTNIGTMTAFVTCSLIVTTVEVKLLFNIGKLREKGEKIGLRWYATRLFWLVVSLAGIVGPSMLMYELAMIAPTAVYRLLAVWGVVIFLFIVYTRHKTRARVAATLAAHAAEEQGEHEGDEQK